MNFVSFGCAEPAFDAPVYLRAPAATRGRDVLRPQRAGRWARPACRTCDFFADES